LQKTLRLIAPTAATPVGAAGGPIDDAISALVNLGYKPAEAKRAVDSVVPEDGAKEMALENLIRRALAVLPMKGENQPGPKLKRELGACGLEPPRTGHRCHYLLVLDRGGARGLN